MPTTLFTVAYSTLCIPLTSPYNRKHSKPINNSVIAHKHTYTSFLQTDVVITDYQDFQIIPKQINLLPIQ